MAPKKSNKQTLARIAGKGKSSAWLAMYELMEMLWILGMGVPPRMETIYYDA